MHEYPITLSIIEKASKHAKNNRAIKVISITLVVGDYSGFIGESISMYFDIIAKDTICEGAKLFIECVKPKLICDACKEYFERKPYSFACPYCGSNGSPTEIGKEFYIKEIEIEN